MRVLVIEDDQETASFLKRALKESGHVAEHAGDGHAGLELARANAYDGPAPLWHGWAIMEAFLAGVEWQKQRQSGEGRE